MTVEGNHTSLGTCSAGSTPAALGKGTSAFDDNSVSVEFAVMLVDRALCNARFKFTSANPAVMAARISLSSPSKAGMDG